MKYKISIPIEEIHSQIYTILQICCKCLDTYVDYCIRLSGKCLSSTDMSFTTMHLYTNMKPNLSNVVILILIEQNGSYVIR